MDWADQLAEDWRDQKLKEVLEMEKTEVQRLLLKDHNERVNNPEVAAQLNMRV